MRITYSSSDVCPSDLHAQIAPCFDIDQALVNVHRTARLIAHRLGQKGGIDAVAHRRFAHGALEQKHLVRARQRIGMLEVDLQLRRATLVDQGVDVQFNRVTKVVHQIEDRVELVDRKSQHTNSSHYSATSMPSYA